MRIFTPVSELPFAGHPTVGTAVLLGRIDGGTHARDFVLELNIGPVPCTRDARGAGQRTRACSTCRACRRMSAPPPTMRPSRRRSGLTSPTSGSTGLKVGALVGRRALHDGAGARARCDQALPGQSRRYGTRRSASTRMPPPTCSAARPRRATVIVPHAHVRAASGRAGGSRDRVRRRRRSPAIWRRRGAYARRRALACASSRATKWAAPSLIELTLKIAGGKLTGASIGGGAVVVMEGTIEA